MRIGRRRILMKRNRHRSFMPMLPLGTTMSDEEYEDWYADHVWDPTRYPGMTIESDLTPAAWLDSLLAPGSFRVEMTAPRGYEAYARVFFPFDWTGFDGNGEWFKEHIRWADMARENGKVVHALMEEETIKAPRVGSDVGGQCNSNLSPEQVEAMTPILARHTSSTEGWFLLWEGFGDLNDKVFNVGVPKVNHPMRNFYLLRGPLDSYAHLRDVPNHWWPDDKAWCLSSDTDFSWSYLAGSRECVDEILGTPVMDALETLPGNPAHAGMDIINDPSGDVRR
jgi:hypothetical protein